MHSSTKHHGGEVRVEEVMARGSVQVLPSLLPVDVELDDLVLETETDVVPVHVRELQIGNTHVDRVIGPGSRAELERASFELKDQRR
jgi:hypothetical protein